MLLIYQAVINVTLSLHNNCNLTSKDIAKIQKGFFLSLFKLM